MSNRAEQIKKLRRRIEEFLRNCNVGTLIKVANFLGIRVQKDLQK